jgi:hypothetical protein
VTEAAGKADEDALVRVKVQSSGPLLVFGILSCLALIALLCYAWYRNAELDAQAPIVETCVKHRVTQKVEVIR